MANEITKGNLAVAAALALFLCPAMCVGVPTSFYPPLLRVTEALVCPDGSRLESQERGEIGPSGRRTVIDSRCVAADGTVVADDVYAKSFAILYAVAFVVLGGLGFAVFRPKPDGSAPAP